MQGLIVERSRGEINDVFTLMIPEISTRNLKISAASKSCDMSARRQLFEGNCLREPAICAAPFFKDRWRNLHQVTYPCYFMFDAVLLYEIRQILDIPFGAK
jgi:hypothetical protein